MAFAGERYYNIYPILLTKIGLWPYQKATLFHTTFIFSVLISLLLFQFMPFFTTTYNMEFVIKQLSYIFPGFVYFSYYNLFYFNLNGIKRLLEQVKLDWGMMDNNEIKILDRYALYCYILTLSLIVTIILLVIILILFEMLPILLDTIVPLNETRSRKLLIKFELFLDEERYFYVYFAYEILTLTVALFTLSSTGSLILALIGHCCATYRIASNLLENVVTKDTLQIPVYQNVRVMHRRISRAVYVHRNSIEFCRLLLDTMNKWFFISASVGVVSLSFNLFRLLEAVILMKEMFEILACFAVVTAHFIIMFLANLIGQLIIDHSAEMFHAAYRTMWYFGPLPIQKLLLFMMQHYLKSDTLLIGGIYVASFEGFSTLITTSISYFTMIYNMH